MEIIISATSNLSFHFAFDHSYDYCLEMSWFFMNIGRLSELVLYEFWSLHQKMLAFFNLIKFGNLPDR